jgi:hypothetical protein
MERPIKRKKKPRRLALRIARKQKLFLKELLKCGNVEAAAHRSRIGKTTVYRWRDEDAQFGADWDEALAVAFAEVEATMVERAKAGSDTLSIFIAKSRWPERYRERFEVNIRNDPQIQAVFRAFAQIMREFVPKEMLDSAINRFCSLTGYNRGVSGGDGHLHHQLSDAGTQKEG